MIVIDEGDYHSSTSEAVAQQVWCGTFHGQIERFIDFVRVPLPKI